MELSVNTFISILFLLIVIYCFYKVVDGYSENVYVESDKDKHYYLLRTGKAKTKEYLKDSADTLSEINERVMKLITHLKSDFSGDPTKKYFIDKLSKNYDSSVLSEAAIDKRYTTFTVDKKDMHICLRTRDAKSQLYDINLLMYVVLHELAHMCNYDYNGTPINGHGQEFIEKFKFLVTEAMKIGVYDYVDYTRTPREYCGIVLGSQIVTVR